MENKVLVYLELLYSQREAAFSAIDGLSADRIWQRPAPKEWCIGEILDHNYLLIGSTFPYIKAAWKMQQHGAERHRERPYATEFEDPYRKASFPMWVGFLWRPRYTPNRPAPLDLLKKENRILHAAVRDFYTERDPALLGNTFVYDPLFGSINLIITLRIGIYHDQLHFDDVFKLVEAFKQ